jgi:hypothetical protein
MYGIARLITPCMSIIAPFDLAAPIQPTLVLLGDSTLDNILWVPTPSSCIAFQLRAMGFNVVNYAADGFTTSDVLNGGKFLRQFPAHFCTILRVIKVCLLAEGGGGGGGAGAFEISHGLVLRNNSTTKRGYYANGKALRSAGQATGGVPAQNVNQAHARAHNGMMHRADLTRSRG